MLGWKKHKLESRLLGEISITSDMQMTPSLWQKVKRNSKANFFTLHFHLHQEAFEFLFTFCHNGGVICISEVIDISPGNLDSSLCFFPPRVTVIGHPRSYFLLSNP